MNREFPLFQSHLDLAQSYWERVLDSDSVAIDATCGNGHDTLFITKCGVEKLYAMDIQEEAIDSAKKKAPRAEFILGCHSSFPSEIEPGSITLVTYNLGYLPGGNKSLTTKTETTLKSLGNALELIKPGGIISITCYPGHDEGAIEEEEILNWAIALPNEAWCCCHHTFCNRRSAPSLLIIQKTLEP